MSCYHDAMTRNDLPSQPRALFLSHGGGPLPILGDPSHAEMVRELRAIAASIERPRAIVVVSAHWEGWVATITSAANPGIIYDYYGFPPESYEIRYPAPGDPSLPSPGRAPRAAAAAGRADRRERKRGAQPSAAQPR